MKKVLLVLSLVALTITMGFSADKKPAAAPASSGSSAWMEPGNFTANVGIGYSTLGLGIFPGAEVMFAQWEPAPKYPVTFGAAVQGLVGFSAWGLEIGVSGMATAHFGLKNFDFLPEYAQHLDFYIGLGVYFFPVSAVNTYWGYNWYSPIGFATCEGVNYFVNDNLAFYAQYDYWYWSYGSVGIRIKF